MIRKRTICKCGKFLFVPEYKYTDYPDEDLSQKIMDHLMFHCADRRYWFENQNEMAEYAEELHDAAL